MKKILYFVFIMNSTCSFAQNVGIGTSAPTEKLDVNGNVNVAGSILANGTDGTAGQVLMKNAAGQLSWGNGSELPKRQAFFFADGSFTIPAGVTEVVIEAWGAGGGGNPYGGGGGGGYIRARVKVSPGNVVTVYIGDGGSPSASSMPGNNGQSTQVAFSGNGSCTASGGQGAGQGSVPNSHFGILGTVGGGYSESISAAAQVSVVGMNGYDGNFLQFRPFQYNNGTQYHFEITGGKGGDAANSINTGGTGGLLMYYGTWLAAYSMPAKNGKVPGGGGGGGTYGTVTLPSPLLSSALHGGSSGANGLVYIWY